MKKLLSLLLTLVMAICIINLNNNHSKAEESNGDTYIITYTYDTSWKYKKNGGAEVSANKITLKAGDKITIKNENYKQWKVAVSINTKSFEVPYNGSSEEYTMINTNMPDEAGKTNANAVVIMNGRNVTITDYAIETNECKKLTYSDRSGSGDIGWKENDTALTPSELKTKFGIEFTAGEGGNPGTVKFTHNLVNTGGTFLKISEDLNIEIDKDITLTNTDQTAAVLSAEASKKIKFLSKGNTLTMVNTGNGASAFFYGELILDNITLDLYNKRANSTALQINNDSLTELINFSKIICTNSAGPYALLVKNGALPATYKVLGKVNLNDEWKETVAVDDGSGTYDYRIPDENGDPIKAKYIKIENVATPTPPTPTPSPEPQPKDESCEKVIGPTWHWNNDKGICEEYATVGTSTR